MFRFTRHKWAINCYNYDVKKCNNIILKPWKEEPRFFSIKNDNER